MGLVYAVVGLVTGSIVAALSLLGAASGLGFASRFGVADIIIMPIVYGGLGFVVHLVTAVVYNWAAGVTGGIRIQTD